MRKKMGGGRGWEAEEEGTPGLRAGALSTERLRGKYEREGGNIKQVWETIDRLTEKGSIIITMALDGMSGNKEEENEAELSMKSTDRRMIIVKKTYNCGEERG